MRSQDVLEERFKREELMSAGAFRVSLRGVVELAMHQVENLTENHSDQAIHCAC